MISLATILIWLQNYRYLVLFPLAAFEGPIISVMVGFLIFLGQFEVIPAFILLIFADVIPDVVYYYIGRFGKRRNLVEKYGSRWKVVSENLKLVEKLWNDHGFKTMFLSKLAYGLSTPFLISAGLIHMPLKRFISLTLPITFFQAAAFLFIGYYLGKSYEISFVYIRNAGYLFASALLLFVGVYILFARYARKQLKEIEKEETLI
jgi:membrane protein DedA with SNARE-associated domain